MGTKRDIRGMARWGLLAAAGGLLTCAVHTTAQTAPDRGNGSAAPPPDASPTTRPNDVSASTRPAPPPSGATTTTAPAQPIDGLNAKELSVEAVLQQLSETEGFIIQKQDKNAKLDTRVTLLARKSLMPDELIAAVNTALRPDNYTVIRRGRTLLVVALDKAIKGDIPVEFGADPEKIPENDNLVTQVIPVRTLDAVKLKADLQTLVAQGVDFTSNAAGNSLIMTDTNANVRRIVKIVHDLDLHQVADSDMKVFHLKYADAEAAQKLVTSLFAQDQNNQQQQQPFPFFRGFGRGGGGGGGRGGGFPGGPGGPGGAGAEEEGRTGKVIAAADTRTNTLVVTGPTDTLKIIETMITQIDSDPSSEQQFFMYHLRNGQAANLAVVLNNLFGNSTGGTGQTNTNTRNTGFGSSSSGFGVGSSGGRGGGGGGGFGGGGGGGFGGGGNNNNNRFGGQGGGGGQNFGQGLSNNSRNAVSSLAGQVYVVADTDTNSLLVTAASKYEKQIRQIIAELDRPVPQVLIKVLVAEVTHDNNADFGADFSILNQRGTSGFGNNFAQTFGTPGSGLAIAFLEKNINITLHALAQQNKLDVLSRPYILASDNQEAEILVGQYVPLVNSNYTTTLGQIVSNYTYQKVGIIVDVTPHINPDGLVTLDVAPEISQLTAQTVSVGPGVNAPVIADRSANSRVAIRDGQTIVIGGLMQDQKTLTINKIPILGDIPLIKYAFSRTQVDKTKTELLIFLTPHVAMNPDVLTPMSNDEMKGTKLTPSAVEPGAFQDHLRGMQRGEAPADKNRSGTSPQAFFAPSTQPDVPPERR